MVAICTEVVLVLPTEDVLNQLRLSVTRFFSCSQNAMAYISSTNSVPKMKTVPITYFENAPSHLSLSGWCSSSHHLQSHVNLSIWRHDRVSKTRSKPRNNL